MLSVEEIESQVAMELPDREMMALVEVNIGDVTVFLPIGIAANVCNVNAAVLAQQFVRQGEATCNATGID
jgi:hypothetical protein